MRMQKMVAKKGITYSLLYKFKGYLILLSLIGIWLIDVFYIVEEKKDNRQKLEKVLQTQSDDFAIESVGGSIPAPSVMAKKLSLLASVQLPRAPLIDAFLSVETMGVERDKAVSVSSATTSERGYPITDKTEMVRPDARTSEAQNTTQQAMLEKSLPEPTTTQVQNVMTQLTDLKTRYIQFLLPIQDLAKEDFLNHMYRCENMQFGTLSRVSPYQLTLLSDKSSRAGAFQASEFLRVAHDYLNRYERNLFILYGQENRPVRIFPMTLDINLATKIAQVTGEKVLKSFSARYFLQGSQLGLTDIVLNQHAVPQNWIISSKGCY